MYLLITRLVDWQAISDKYLQYYTDCILHVYNIVYTRINIISYPYVIVFMGTYIVGTCLVFGWLPG